MPFVLSTVVAVVVMSLIAGSMNKDYTLLPIFCAYIWNDEPLYAAFVAMFLAFLLGSAIKLSKAWR